MRSVVGTLSSSRLLFRRFWAIKLMPGQIVALAGAVLILVGALLLMLPFSTASDVRLSFLDAVFTATSAVCVTGLIVMDTPQEFTMFGQLVILCLIQVGGLGYAAMATLLLIALGHRIGLRERMMLAETLSTIDMQGLVRFVKSIVLITFVVEGLGVLILTIRFAFDMHVAKALYFGIFHAVSAFNNAGFSLFSNSLGDYRGDVVMNGVVIVLVILGSIGFIVFQDVIEYVKGTRFRLQTHTKLVVAVTLVLVVVGALGICVLEWNNPNTLEPLGVGESLLVSSFQAVSRTSGFSTIDLSEMEDATLYFLILLMAIGGSPGSMAGGIKTTTFGVVCLTIWSVLRRRADVEVFYRRIPYDFVIRAVCLSIIAMGAVTLATLILAYAEEERFLALMFEVTSAMGIVGLSVGDGEARSLSALLTDFGKVLIIFCMLLGRFGPLMIGLFAIKSPSQMRYRFPQGRIVIG